MKSENRYRLVLLLLIIVNIHLKADDGYLTNTAWQNQENVFSMDQNSSSQAYNSFNQSPYTEDDDALLKGGGPPGPPDSVPINQYVLILLITAGIAIWRYGRNYQN
ncbi:hypothetical protein [Chryseobacterium koreense]|uniref:Uncharacterized protein n=1 Tax=Chryseobacterium koreense CCUG 49689 TaxID=1304281 RepID=A0A0J7LNY0_9FLAO|nr:hypothetical protein [Chryseobacterium koreense]KMQ70790.1 hypothetical protein ACM44_10805 [Chryseobacterium koreense CCUG 49689]MBB5333690.1 hypothetical protein [Chryseobacterium koreense]